MLGQLEVAAAAVLRTPPAVHLSEVVFLSPAARGGYISDSFQVGGISSTVNQFKLKWWMSRGQWGEGGAKAVTESDRRQQTVSAWKVRSLSCAIIKANEFNRQEAALLTTFLRNICLERRKLFYFLGRSGGGVALQLFETLKNQQI